MSANWCVTARDQSALSARALNIINKNGSSSLAKEGKVESLCTCMNTIFHSKLFSKVNYVDIFDSCVPVVLKPSWRQTTRASGAPQKSSHTVPQASPKQSSTRPSYMLVPPARRRSPSAQRPYQNKI